MNFKFKPFSNLFSLIKTSCEKNNNISSTRLTSYIILSMIVLFCIYFLSIGVYIILDEETTIAIPNELLIVFGALLTHQLTLLGINKNAETKQKIASQGEEII